MLRRFHPLLKLALCLAWILASLLIFRLSFQIGMFALAVTVLLIDARVPIRRVLLLTIPFALFGFGFFTTSVLFQAESGFAVQMAQEQGGGAEIGPGLILFFRVMACGMTSAVFVLTTDPGQFVRALMRDLRLPAPAGFAMLQAMHMVPDLQREALSLRMARAMRLGQPMRRIPRPGEAVSLAIPLLAFAIRRASRAAMSMEARGLQPGQSRTYLPQPEIDGRDRWQLTAGLAVLLVAVALSLSSAP